MNKFSHLDAMGAAQMIDISAKSITIRTAQAKGIVHMQPETLELIRAQTIKKGDVLATARIAAIMAAKKTPELIPLCHCLALSKVTVDFAFDTNKIEIISEVKCHGQTGVEMEALTACTIACLTIYDMCKAVDQTMVINKIRLTQKTGGKSDISEAG